MDVRFVKKLYADLHCKHIEKKDRDKDSPSTLQKKRMLLQSWKNKGRNNLH